MTDIDTLHFGRLASKLPTAVTLFRRHSARLKADPMVVQALAELDARLTSLSTVMSAAGFPARCGSCAERFPGGCCDATIAEDTDAELLLINLLLGVEIMMQKTDPASCTFVGPKGCSLRAKPHICWNYNCPEVKREILPNDLAFVQSLVGLALQQLTTTEEAIRNCLRHLGAIDGAATEAPR